MLSTRPPWTAPFVVDLDDEPPATITIEKRDPFDLYLDAARPDQPLPLVVLVHGGPLPVDLPVSPRNWPVNQGYATLLALRGMAACVVDHPLHDFAAYRRSFDLILTAIDTARQDPRIDAGRVIVWVFSGGGPFLAPLLADPPTWLRGLAASYPILTDRTNRTLPAGFHPVEVVESLDSGAAITRAPILLTSVAREETEAAEGVERFVDAAERHGVRVSRLDLEYGCHAFDARDHEDWAVDAIEWAIGNVVTLARKTPHPGPQHD